MFVSTYTTYVGSNSSNKTDSYKARESKGEADFFAKELSNSVILKSHTDKNLPIDYISNYKSFNNQQKLQEQLQTQDELRLKFLTHTINAKTAYDENISMFSLVRKPHTPLNLTPKIDERLPREIKEIKEKNLRHAMVNTYEANDRYFQITAA